MRGAHFNNRAQAFPLQEMKASSWQTRRETDQISPSESHFLDDLTCVPGEVNKAAPRRSVERASHTLKKCHKFIVLSLPFHPSLSLSLMPAMRMREAAAWNKQIRSS